MFFGVMRSYKHGGENRKPDCQQFQSALRRALADKNITHGKTGNCTPLDQVVAYCAYSNIGTISSRTKKLSVSRTQANEMYTDEDIEEVLQTLDEITASYPNSPNSHITDLNDISISYVASLIELKIINDKKFKCSSCKNAFSENEELHQAFTSKSHSNIACRSTFEICRNADYFLKLDMLKGQYSFNLIFQSIKSSLNIDCLFENTDFKVHGHEKIDLIEEILYR